MTNTPARFGPIRLATGVRPRHVICYLFAAFVSIGLFTYLTALTPYVLKVNLHVPDAQQGRISGDLQFWQEIMVLGVVGLWGAMADRYGRRLVYAAGFFVLAAGYFIYPMADSVSGLFAGRLVWGFGIAGLSVLLATVNADYPAEQSRGTMTGIAFFLNAIGSVIFFVVLTKMPKWFAASGINDLWSGRYAYFAVAGLAVLTGLVMLGLKPGRPDGARGRQPLRRLVAEGLAAARNPRIALAYASAFAARADMAIITIFITLWVVKSSMATGEGAGLATARAGMVVGIVQGTGMIWSPLFGYIGDRMDRLRLLLISFTLAAIGYTWVGLLPDIRGPGAIPALIALGIGQVSAILGSTVLLSQEAPPHARGSAFGMQTFFGGLGILAISAAGGRLFDAMGPGSPFVAVGVANAVVLTCGILLRLAERRAVPAAVRTG